MDKREYPAPHIAPKSPDRKMVRAGEPLGASLIKTTDPACLRASNAIPKNNPAKNPTKAPNMPMKRGIRIIGTTHKPSTQKAYHKKPKKMERDNLTRDPMSHRIALWNPAVPVPPPRENSRFPDPFPVRVPPTKRKYPVRVFSFSGCGGTRTPVVRRRLVYSEVQLPLCDAPGNYLPNLSKTKAGRKENR